jgi:hypothetical protein
MPPGPRRPWAILFFALALSCGSHADDTGDAGAGTGGTGASGGTGGTAGGTAGNGGDSGAGGTGGKISSDASGCGCVTGHVGWGMDGGLVLYTEASALETCSVFTHQRAPRAPDPPAISCKQDIGDCTGVVSAGDVTRAIANADVQAAIAVAPILYGEDPRPYDGQVVHIQIGSAIIEVGVACRVAGCKSVPAGVQNLVTLLQTVTMQQLAREPCRSSFPPTP